MYIARHLEVALRNAERTFPAMIVTGARQTGKTTLLRHAKGGVRYVTLDDPVQLQTAAGEPGTFFRINPPPVVVDEIQYAPGIFPYIKMLSDESGEPGQFFLSGSQQFSLMKNVSESLAGRICVLTLSPLSRREIEGGGFVTPFVPTPEYMAARRSTAARIAYPDVWGAIHRGGMPAVLSRGADWSLFYSSYVKTYVERDVRALSQIGDETAFMRFMTAVAAGTGGILNCSSLSRDVGVSVPTIERWISVLLASNIIFLLRPYHNNARKRAVKTPKVYFMDTGLAAYLTRWNTPETLERGAASGAFFETYVVSEIVKGYLNAGMEPPLYFYRDRDQREIDLVIHLDGVLYPIEIKKHADPRAGDVRAFGAIDGIAGQRRGPGGVICLYDEPASLGGDDAVIPLWYV
jgi:predicted AAA+ superfamily ATPase